MKTAYIEPGCFIGHNVKIGDNARILYGSVIKNAVVGDNFLCNEYALIGANGFNMAEDLDGNKIRIPSLGYVIIGNNVEIGAYNNISCGSGGDTIIEDWVKIDAHVHLGHDVHLKKNYRNYSRSSCRGICVKILYIVCAGSGITIYRGNMDMANIIT